MTRRKIVNNKNTGFNLRSLRTYILFGVCGILAVSSIFMAIESATSGAEIQDLQKKEVLLTNKEQELQESLVENLSVNSLQEKSSGMGFTKVTNLVYVEGGIPVARLP